MESNGFRRFRAVAASICVVTLAGFAVGQSIESLMASGNMLLQNGAYDQAVTKFRQVLGRDPGNFEAQFNLAFAYMNWGQSSQAATEFKKALAINGQCSECWSNLALVYENLGQSDQATSALHKAVNVSPGNIEARLNLATMYANNGRMSDAIAQYKQVIQIDGRNVEGHLNLSKCLISSGNYAEAKHYLKTALGLDPNEGQAYWELGNMAWKHENKKDEALANYRKAITLEPNSQVFYENLGLLLEEMQKKQEAIELWRKCLIYQDDALKKEEIQYRIELLERGESPSGKETPEALFGKATDRSEKIARLREELGRENADEAESPRLITTESLDVGSDLESIGEQEEGAFDFDMKKALRKKKREKGVEE